MPAAQQVQVKMKDGLARAAAVIEDSAVAFEEFAFARKLRGH